MRKGIVGIYIALFTLSACDQLPWTDEGKARHELASALVDPPSIRFKVITKSASNLCGTFDGKNRMGAYTGGSLFIYDKATGAIDSYTDAPDYSDYDTWSDDSDSPRGREAYEKMESGCNFPQKWAKVCSAVSAPAIPTNETFCKLWKEQNWTQLKSHNGKYSY